MKQTTTQFMQNLIENEPARPQPVTDPAAELEDKINKMVDDRINEILKKDPEQVIMDATVQTQPDTADASAEAENVNINSEENIIKEEN